MNPIILTKQQYPLWDAFAYSHPYSSIHQTTRWAHFQSNIPSRDKFWILVLTTTSETRSHTKVAFTNPSHATTSPTLKGTKILAGTVLIKHRLPNHKHCWLYSPRGPLLTYSNPTKAAQELEVLTQKIKEIAKQENAIFYRIDPLVPGTTHNKNALHFHNFRSTKSGFQPEDTLILDLTKTEGEILAQMKPKGRYNIHLAEKKGVKIVEADPPAGHTAHAAATPASAKTPKGQKKFQSQIAAYYKILQETLSRDKFYGHGIGFYKSMIERLAPDERLAPAPLASPRLAPTIKTGKTPFAKLYLAYHNKTPIAGLVATFYKDTAIYYYGASSNAHRNLMAPYLLQWHAITEAKQYGCKYYDFLGIAPPIVRKNSSKNSAQTSTTQDELGPSSHPWRGVTEFKRKFGGTHVKYLPAQELTIRPFIHFIYKLAKTARKKFH